MEKIELKCGLEIHQQLDTRKLFCNCPSILRQDAPDYTFERKLQVVAGETGSIDLAAEYEAEKSKSFVYQGYNDNCCLVEMDEEPPHQLNPEAMNIALQISLLLNCEIIPYTQIMRKTVIDGSNTSGFQRTLLLAKNGYVETEYGKVGIEAVFLEEDAARIVEQKKETTIYKLDRLGIPLVEIATSPDIKSPEQAKQVALKIGEILRACKVKRGIGTIRQDVNMSIAVDGKWGERTELKGVQEPELIILTLQKETEREINLIKQGKSQKEVRKALENGDTKFLRPMPGAARMYPETDLPLLHISRDTINQAKKNLPKLRSELKSELQKKGLNPELINLILQENKLNDFKELLEIYNNPELIAKMVTLWQNELAVKYKLKREAVEKILTLDILETILQGIPEKIKEGDVRQIMEELIQGKSIKEVLQREKLENIDEEILKIIKEKPGLNANAYMGLVMAKFKGKLSGKEAMDAINRILKK